jgi:hypothetical protein
VLYELSTPFLNIHWFLDKAGKTGSTVQLVNGIGLIAAFFGCRLIWGNYQTVQLSLDALSAWKVSASAGCFNIHGGHHHRSSSSASSSLYATSPPTTPHPLPLCSADFPTRLLTVYLVGNTILSALNIYWFGLMLKALRKRFTPAVEQSSSSTVSVSGTDRKGTVDESKQH